MALTPGLEQAYLENLERECAEDIKSCAQDPTCVNDIIEAAKLRAVSAGIDGKEISNFQKQIGTWSYTQEEVA